MGKKLLRLGIVAASLILLAGCGKQKDIEQVDGMIYTFIVAKIEGNDDLLADLLTDKAEGILKPGRHAFPGAADELNGNYTIVRYDDHYEDGTLLYQIDFYRPPTGKYDVYNVVVINDEEEGWLIAKNSSVDEYLIQDWVAAEEGTVVHEPEGR